MRSTTCNTGRRRRVEEEIKGVRPGVFRDKSGISDSSSHTPPLPPPSKQVTYSAPSGAYLLR